MVKFISCIVALFMVFWIPYLLEKDRENKNNFGEGKGRYDFKDYVNNKADKYNK